MESEFVTMTEAQALLGVSRFKIWQLVRNGEIETFESQLDRRQKLIRRADLDALRNPRPRLVNGDAKKAAALAA